MTTTQSPDGHLRHLLTLDGLDKATLETLLDRAQQHVVRPGQTVRLHKVLQGKTIANLFFEASTRTRASFELAAQRLGAHVLNLDINLSSTAKGETVVDTARTLQAMNVDAFVIRHRDTGVQALVAEDVAEHVAVINAGESHLNHPTQGLLDMLTIRQHKQDFTALRIAIVGDIRHSRVARSAIHALTTLGVGDLRLVGPEPLLPQDEDLAGMHVSNMDEGVAGCDVVMMLRIQKERIQGDAMPDVAHYHEQFGMDERRLGMLKPDGIVMHPGPMNRGVEISDAVADGPRSVILEQVNNGIAARMAVLEMLMENRTQ